jgi:hypothetical protein
VIVCANFIEGGESRHAALSLFRFRTRQPDQENQSGWGVEVRLDLEKRAMKCICVMAGALVLAISAYAAPAQVTPITNCPAPPGINVVVPSGLPAALRTALPGDIALPGKPLGGGHLGQG